METFPESLDKHDGMRASAKIAYSRTEVVKNRLVPRSTEDCLTGEFLYGDDFRSEESLRWFRQEMEACYEIRKTYPPGYTYPYHALHWEHGYRHLPEKVFENVLGYGAALGEELDGIRKRCRNITIIEPAEGYHNGTARYVVPAEDGKIPLPSQSFDLITCFGTLHHICNVTTVFDELVRCLQPGGYLLISEPVISLGDWRFPRNGQSPNERGIPLPIFRRMIQSSDLQIIRQTKFHFQPFFRLCLALASHPSSSFLLTKVDAFLCKFMPYRYHATNRVEKIRFACMYFVLRKV
jgi:SAM-dependent methyltransferase